MIIDNAAPAGAARPHAPVTKDEADPRAARRNRMGQLLQRYPDIGPDEQRELADFLKSGNPDDLALVTYGDGLAGKAIVFKKDHPEHFGSGGRLILAWALFLIVFVGLIALATMMF